MSQPMQLSPEQLAQYERDGYLIVPNLLSPEECAEFLAYEELPKPADWRQHLDNHKSDEQWSKIAHHPNMVSIARQILDGQPLIVQTMYLRKQPVDGKGTAMHQDTHYLPTEPNTLMACWLALNDTDGQNGGLAVVPGSHKRGLLSTHKTENTDDHDSWEIDYDMIDPDGRRYTQSFYSFDIDDLKEGDVIRLEVPTGAGVFFNGLTIHGSFGNQTKDRYRHAYATHFVKEGTWVYRGDVHDTVPA